MTNDKPNIDLAWAKQRIIGFEKMMKQAEAVKASEKLYKERAGYIPEFQVQS